ncbi:hypothetical protein SAMN04488543_2483 [Friedmanniella luteola]|uniref:N-acetyltransferase domain-containing protein n=1 Tax=Friedmanniella luteola TaxID=546871 RepID=A0A1H1VIE4_9ACTN|nr:hypothetical protein SAMN04488543_2483 [Friedmanniella luteola]
MLTNATWCDGVCRGVGLPTRWSADAWSTARRSPAGYPDAVTLRRGLAVGTVLAGVEDGPGCSVKDSFTDLDLAPAGFAVLFEARWIRRPAPTSASPPTLSWTEVRAAGELAAWCRRLDVPPLPPVLLAQEGLHVFAADEVGAGFVLSRTGPVVGVAYAVPGTADPAALWADLVGLARRRHPGADLVGYERGADLEHARAAGFAVTGSLRVWMR